MSYIGNIPTTAAFVTDQFSANGSGTTFTLSAAPATTSSILVAVSGVLQDPSTYSVSGTTLTFSAAPPAGTGNISVRFLGIPASGVVTTAYRTVTDFTATAGQTTFSPPSYTAGFIDVYRNGVKLGAADFTATNGTTVVLANACTAGDLVQIVSFQVSSVLNAITSSGGTFTGSVQFAGGNGVWDANGNVGIGTSSPSQRLDVRGAIAATDGGTQVTFISNAGEIELARTDGDAYIDFKTSIAEDADCRIQQLSNGLRFMTGGSGSIVERMRIDNTGQQFSVVPSGSTLYPEYKCRAWVNFNGTGTVAIRASGNVSSITDNGTGDYTVNFTTAMPDANYSTYVGGQGPSTASLANLTALYSAPTSNTLVSPLTSSFRFGSYSFQGNASDSAFLCVAIFR